MPGSELGVVGILVLGILGLAISVNDLEAHYLAGIIVPQALSVLLGFAGAVGLWLVLQKRGSPSETATARR